ncbi:hypothetical protein GCM10020219_078880 [Nonomuraea dietziae]
MQWTVDQPSRRDVLRGALAAGAALTLGGGVTACGARGDAPRTAGGDQWRQYQGTTLNFISENTAPTAAIAADIRPFTDLTGIDVRIVTLELTALVQRVALDLASGRAQYQVIYADPYQVLAPYQRGLVDLRTLQADPNLPDLPGGVEDFIPAQLDAAGRFVDAGPVYALPYDAPTMIWQYRRDLFDKYRGRMAADLGFDPAPGGDRTWEEYFRMAEWFNKNATSDVRYGTGHQARQHDSLMNDFSNVLWSYGGTYFDNGKEVGRLGARDPGPRAVSTPTPRSRARRSTSACSASPTPPRRRGTGTASAPPSARDGSRCAPTGTSSRPATSRCCRERSATRRCRRAPRARRTCTAAPAWRSARTRCPTSAARPGCSWCGPPRRRPSSPISRARRAGAPRRAPPSTNCPRCARPSSGPRRCPTCSRPAAVRQAWQADRIGLRPKIPMWNECNTAIFTQLSRMLTGGASPEEAMRSIKSRVDQIVARGWVA